GFYAIALSNDGKRVLVADHDRSITVFDAATGRRLPKIGARRDNNSYTFAFSPDSSLLAFGDYNGAVHLSDVGQGRETRVIKTAQHKIQALAFSPDGQLVAAGTQDLLVRAWDVGTGELKHTFPKLNTPARLITFRPDDKMVAAVGDDCVVHVWHIPPGNEARMFKHNGQVRSIAFSPDSAVFAIAGEDKVVGLWDPNTGAYRGALQGHA